MKDELEALERRVRERLSELRPLIEEFRDLEQVARRLGISRASASRQGQSPAPAGATRSRARPRRTTSRTRAAGQKRGPQAPRPRAAAAAAPAASRQRPARPKTTDASRSARPGERRDQLLALVNERPGITVREAGEQMGVDATALYRVMHRLESEGAIKKEGRELRPA
jgi:hypothetical protein